MFLFYQASQRRDTYKDFVIVSKGVKVLKMAEAKARRKSLRAAAQTTRRAP
jgi:hypothetical protein